MCLRYVQSLVFVYILYIYFFICSALVFSVCMYRVSKYMRICPCGWFCGMCLHVYCWHISMNMCILHYISAIYLYLCDYVWRLWIWVLCLKLCISAVYMSMACSSVSIWNAYMYMMCLYLFLDVCAYMVQTWLAEEGCCDCEVYVYTCKHTCGRCLKLCMQVHDTVQLSHWIAFLNLPVLPSILISLAKIYPQILQKAKTRKFLMVSEWV